MKHIFLTGEIQTGKSTVIQKTLAILDVPYGGFFTYFGSDRTNRNRLLYIRKAGLPPVYDGANAVARFSGAPPPEVFPERFNVLGTQFIREAAERCGLIIMDECGNLENQAFIFKGAVLGALEGSVPVLGVVKLSAAGWVNQIRNHPMVTLITVDIHNRDALPEILADYLK